MSIIIVAILESQSALGLYFLVLFLVYSFHCLSLHCKVRMLFFPSCPLGWLLSLCSSVLRTLRSVLTGSLEPLRGIKVCYMYYTDVFVGHNKDNIDKLNKALNAELKASGLTVDLDQLKALASGLESFIGYGSGGKVDGSGIGKTGGGPQNYASSYNSNATWEKLCEKCQCNSNSCKSCSCSSGSSDVCSDPLKCCENCDVRKAAKIFLGMLPCLYYALKYLYDKCNGGWKDFEISDDNSLRHFLVGMGYEIEKLQGKTGQEISSSLSSLFTSSNGPLQSLYEKSKKYFPSPSPVPSSDSDSKPKTVREILLWLSGLPFSNGFKDLLQHCKGLCDSIKDSSNPVNFIDFDKFKNYLFDSCFLSPFVLGAIESSKSNEKGFPPYHSEWKDFSYPEDPSDLLEKLCENVRKIFPPLKFLCMQCELDKDDAGWKDCYFGRNCSVDSGSGSSGSPSVSSSGCQCPNSKTYLCTKDHSGKCSGSSHSSSQCPHPLQRFLLDGSESTSTSKALQNFRTPFHSSTVPPMGFSAKDLPSPGRNGEALYLLLEAFSTVSSLTSLLKFELHVSRTPPETLGELFGFFLQFKDSGVFKKDFADYASKEPGRPDGQKFTNAFQTALQKLYGSSHSSSSHSGSHPYDLYSLHGCDGPKGSGATCGPYLNPLAGDVYKNFIDNFDETYLSWICYLPKDFKTLLEEFQGKFSKCCSSGTSCTSIVKCPCALPFIYSHGFTFMKASTLSGKKCSDFISQLKKVLEDPQSTLLSLIAEIESFLWSIRHPFFLFILAFWAFVISYFLYVQLYKLDLLHLKSHAHLPRSFKILPSTLFSDASSRLKDLSYFTL
ncbi:variant erythrocyte surface antigen-1 family protein [Babesia divergens]|uniref:Variant erythrocyte surface antigen-1 family protein n=1 Tax=Babesia divergens TaxID=32595 RepID=A0AAD9G5E8_BABDI|nr:variant erythrocyte surface antigen-1 family protein [Babesia divergens]